MLKGDLRSAPLAPLLIQLADEELTGCLHIADPDDQEALIYLKVGLVYAVSVPGRRPQLGAKLVSSGALAPEALADALEAQRTELQGWRLGELLVHLGYVDQPVVEAFVKEQVHDALWDLFRWTEGEWRLRKSEKTREDVAPPMTVADLLANLRARGYEWGTISSVLHGPGAVPVLSTRGEGAPETTLDADAFSMLCKIDGRRSVAALAADCGFTLFEAGTVLVTLVQAGFVDIIEDEVCADGASSVSSVSSALQANADGDASDLADELAALARLIGDGAAGRRDDQGSSSDGDVDADADGAAEAGRELVYAAAVAGVEYDLPSPVNLHPGSEESFAVSLERVSAALAEVLGPETPTLDPFEVPSELRPKRVRKPPPPKPTPTPESERRSRVRAAAAAELAAAHALAEALRSAQPEDDHGVILGWPEPEESDGEGDAEVVDLAAVRREAERVEAERIAAEQEVARLEAERIAADEAVAQLEAEQIAAAEHEAARLESERVAAEEEAARVAAEEEAARVAAEEEAARLEAERLEAERLEAERLEAERVEAERLAAEEEAARIAAEEEAARLEWERVAAEEEAARVEAERLAAEEAARIAAEEEAARLEAERLDAERVATEEFARLEAERLAAEVSDAEDAAWSEYWQREADAAAAAEAIKARQQAAAVLLMELAAEPAVRVEEPAEPVFESVAEETDDTEDAADDDEPPVETPPEPAEVDITSPMPVFTDTAALLRELSSLGFDDEPKPPPPTHRQHHPRPAAPPQKKKRGLFGF